MAAEGRARPIGFYHRDTECQPGERQSGKHHAIYFDERRYPVGVTGFSISDVDSTGPFSVNVRFNNVAAES